MAEKRLLKTLHNNCKTILPWICIRGTVGTFNGELLSCPIIFKPTATAWSVTRDLVRKYDEDRIKMSADLGQTLLWNGTKEHWKSCGVSPLQYVREKRRKIVICINQRSALIEFSSEGEKGQSQKYRKVSPKVELCGREGVAYLSAYSLLSLKLCTFIHYLFFCLLFGV